MTQDLGPTYGREVEHRHERPITSCLYRCRTVAVIVDDVVGSLARVVEELLALLGGQCC